jgi:glycosyltransferase involved in cell wall biosynthesis
MILSIIIPFYNSELSLQKTVDTVLRQTITDIEILLVDDGSQDGGSLIARKIANHDSRVKVFYQKNKGVSAARNHGLQKARGQYIAFVDADDSISETMYKELLSKMIVFKADICVSGISVNGVPLKDLPEQDCLLDCPEKIHKILIAGILGFPNKSIIIAPSSCRFIFKRDLLKKNELQFDTQIGYHEDLVFSIAALSQADKVYIDERPSYNYSYNESIRSNRHKLEKKIASHKRVIRFLYNQKIKDPYGISVNYQYAIIRFIIIVCGNICRSENYSLSSSVKTLQQYYLESEPFLEKSLYVKSMPFKTKILFYLFSRNQFLILFFIFWLTKARSYFR